MAASGSGTPVIRPIVPKGKDNDKLASTESITIAEDLGALQTLKAFSIRNGDVSAAKSLLIRPAVPAMFHWCPISGMQPQDAIENVGAFVRVAYAQMLLGSEPTVSNELKRKRALILGVVRAVVTQLYEITDSDIIPGERAQPILVATKGQNGRYTFGLRTGLNAAERTAIQTGFTSNENERAATAAIHMCAIGLPACQGFSLVMTGHHYLSDPKSHSRRCYKVIEGAYWTHSAVKAWFDDDADEIRDAMWHKACHPISLSLKRSVSQSLACKQMIIEAGAGAAASRLPALEPELRRAKSYKTLLQTVRAMYEEIGGTTNFIVLDEAIAAAEHFPLGEDVQDPHGYPSVPVSVNSRSRALKHLANVCDSCDDVVGHAWGFYCAMDDKTQMLAAANVTSTLRTANSLSKLDTVSPAAYRAGLAFYDDYAAMKQAKRAKGEYSVTNLLIGLVNERGIEISEAEKKDEE